MCITDNFRSPLILPDYLYWNIRFSKQNIPAEWGKDSVTHEEWVWFRQNREQLLRLIPYSDILDWASDYPTMTCMS